MIFVTLNYYKMLNKRKCLLINIFVLVKKKLHWRLTFIEIQKLMFKIKFISLNSLN